MEHKKISDKRKQTGQERYPEWDCFDAMDTVLGQRISYRDKMDGERDINYVMLVSMEYQVCGVKQFLFRVVREEE